VTASKANEKPTGLALLREPFAAHQISKLPKLNYCCSNAPNKVCQKHEKKKCSKCGAWISTGHVDLDFVGHAALTDRLLDADPQWTWEPVANPEALGLPVLPDGRSMWIRLTVCGVTRYGFGDAQGKGGGDAIKEIIGDALRNAAMRFGAALDLWHKGDLHADDDTAAIAEHKQLVDKTLADDKKAERSGGVPPEDDPWAGDEVAKPGSEGTVTELGAEIEAAPTVEALRDVYRRVVDLRTAGELTKAQAAGLLEACTARGDVLKGVAA
jgi:hypothetical protein